MKVCERAVLDYWKVRVQRGQGIGEALLIATLSSFLTPFMLSASGP